MAMERPRVGLGPPEVTLPTLSPSGVNIHAPSLTGGPCTTVNPIRFFSVPDLICESILFAPGKFPSARLLLAVAEVKEIKRLWLVTSVSYYRLLFKKINIVQVEIRLIYRMLQRILYFAYFIYVCMLGAFCSLDICISVFPILKLKFPINAQISAACLPGYY